MSKQPDLKLVPNTNLKIVDFRWFNGRDVIGVVLVEDMTMHYVKAYIGLAQSGLTNSGNSEIEDVEFIAQWGTKIPKEMAESLFGPLPDWSE